MRKIHHEMIYPPAALISGCLEGEPEQINQLLNFYENYINMQIQKYHFDSDCAFDREDLKQEIKLQIVKSLEHLRIKLNDKGFLEYLNSSNG